jgi:hypothetical protein
MSMTEAPYSICFKTPRGNLFTIRGNTAEELNDNLNAAPQKGVLGLIAEIEGTLAGQPKVSASRPAAAPAAAPAKPAESQGSQQLPAGMGNPACGTCGEPTRFDKEGLSQQSGKPYRRYLCTANQLHRATFV